MLFNLAEIPAHPQLQVSIPHSTPVHGRVRSSFSAPS